MIQPKTTRSYNRRPARERLAYHLDQRLIQLLRHGRQAVDPKTGKPLMDKGGEPMMTPPAAADISAAVKRLDQHSDGTATDDPRTAENKQLVEDLRQLQDIE